MTLNSLSLFVGTGECNAYCKHCAGTQLRKYAPIKDGVVNEAVLEKSLQDCYNQGARYLSLSSSGEPTLSPLSVTKTLEIIHKQKEKGIITQEIRMYQDDPGTVAYMTLLKNMYKNHPVKYDILGTEESIKEITVDILSKAHQTFYNPKNMILFVAGNFIPK